MEHAASTRICVVVGRFNPAILNPDWIVKEGILPSGEAGIGGLLGGSVIRYNLGGLTWQPSVGKLAVEADTPETNPGEFVAQILDRLTHTPVRAVGNNFVFELSEAPEVEKVASAIATRLPMIFASAEVEQVKRSASVTLARGVEYLVGITCEQEGEGPLTVSFNFHRDAASAVTAAEAARHFGTDEREAQQLLGVLLQ